MARARLLRVRRPDGSTHVYTSTLHRTECGRCDFFEDDGTLQHQCADCALADAMRVYLMRINDTPVKTLGRPRRSDS